MIATAAELALLGLKLIGYMAALGIVVLVVGTVIDMAGTALAGNNE